MATFDEGTADETERVSYDQWYSTPVTQRATIYMAAINKSVMMPTSLTEADFFVLGLAHNDEEAIQLLAQESIDTNYGMDVAEVADAEASFNSLLAWTDGPEGKRFNGRHSKALLAGLSTHNNPTQWYDWALGGALLLIVAPAAVTVGSIALKGAAAAAGASAGYLAGTTIGAGLTLFAAQTSAAAGSSSAGQAIQWLIYNHGTSKTAQILRASPAVMFKALRATAITSAIGWQGAEALVSATQGSEAAADFAQFRVETISRADAEKAGFQIEKAGVALSGGSFNLYDTAITIKDADGNLISSDEAAAILSGEEEDIPDPFAEAGPTSQGAPSTEDGEIPLNQNIIPSDQIPGTADQYRATGDFSEYDPDAALEKADAAIAAERLGEIRGEVARRKRENPFLGVDEDYTRITREGAPSGPQYGSIRSADDVGALKRQLGGAIYRVKDATVTISQMSPDQIVAFQERAIDAGLIDPESRPQGISFRLGTIDDRTFAAIEKAMTQANQNGNKQTWEEALDVMVRGREEYKEKFGDPDAPPTWTPRRAYMAPDYATISQNVKGLFGRELGRDPNGWEMDLLADEFKSDKRAEFDEEMAADRAVFDAVGRHAETGEVNVPAAQQDIDPLARMAENFDDEFSDELDAKARWAGVQSKSRNLFGSFDKLSRA